MQVKHKSRVLAQTSIYHVLLKNSANHNLNMYKELLWMVLSPLLNDCKALWSSLSYSREETRAAPNPWVTVRAGTIL